MRVLLIVCCLFSLVSLEEAPNLRSVCTDLSVVSRLTTGISIQNELLENKITGNEVLTKLIKIRDPKFLQDLKEIETADISKKLDDFVTILKSFDDSSIQKPIFLRENLKALSEFIDHLEFLESASQVTLTEDFRTKASEATDGKVNIRATVLGERPLITIAQYLGFILNETVTELPTEQDDIYNMKHAILGFRSELDGYEDYVKKLKDYETELGKLIAFEGLNLEEILEPVKQLKELVVRYDGTMLGEPSMADWLKSLKEESVKVETSNILTSQTLLNDVVKEMDQLFPVVKDLSIVQINSNPEESVLFKNEDFNDGMFMKKFAEGEKKHMEKLKKSLVFLEAFSGKIEVSVKGFGEFTQKYSEFDVFSLKRIVSRIQHILEKMKSFNDVSSTITTSLDNSIKCFETHALTYSRKDVDLTEFEKTFKFSHDLQVKISDMHESVKEVLAITEIENHEILKKLKAVITDEVNRLGMRMTATQAWDITKAMRGVGNVQEFYENFKKAATLLLKIDNHELNKMLKEKVDFDVISRTQEILSGTNLIPALRCLKDLKDPIFNHQDSIQLMNFVDQMRTLKEEDIQKTKEILEKMGSIKKGLNDIETSSRRSKRNAESGEKQLLKMEKKTAEELENGVKALRKITYAADKKDTVSTATNYDQKVHDAVSSIQLPPIHTVWTQTVRKRMQEVFKEISDFDKTIGDNKQKELPTIFSVLSNATVVKGMELDTNVFKVSVPTSLESSSDADVQAASKTFKELGSLDLNFAAHQSALTTASHTLGPLQTFFDQFFGIDRTPKKMMQKGPGGDGAGGNENGGESENGDSSMFLLVIAALLLAVGCCLIIIALCIKRRNRNKKLQHKETWRHLRFLAEGRLTEKDETQYTPLHMAVLKKKFDEVKRLVKSGAYVDVHCYGKTIETPLHTAVFNKSSNIVEFLIKRGADLDALDSNYETPLDRAKGNKDLENLIKKYKNKNYKKTLPQVFPSDKYKIYIDENVKGKKEFCERYKQNIVNKIDKATHVIVKTGKEGSFELDKDEASLAYLGIICSHKILMSSDWLKASVDKQSNFTNDYKFRVKKIKFNGKSFKKVDDIQLDNSKMRIPYLANTIIHFDQAALHTIDWTALKKLAIELGSQNVDEFPVMQGMMAGKCPYYRQDLGHILVIYTQSNADKLTAMYPILKTDKAYTFLERNEFIELLLSQKVVHKKLKGNESVEKDNKKTGSGETTGTTGTMGNSAMGGISGSAESTTPGNISSTPTPSQTPTPSFTPSATPSAEQVTPTPSAENA